MSRTNARAPRTTSAPSVVALVPPDPWVAHVLSLQREGTRVVQLSIESAGEAIRELAPDVVVVDISSPVAADLRSSTPALPVVGIYDPNAEATAVRPEDLDVVVTRPIVPAELHKAIRRATGTSTSDPNRSPSRLDRSWTVALLSVAVAVAAVSHVATANFNAWHLLLLVAAAAAVAIRLRKEQATTAAIWAEAIAVALALAATGAHMGYVPLALLAALEAGLLLGVSGAIPGGLLSIGAGAGLFFSSFDLGDDPGRAIAWVTLFPLASLAGSCIRRIAGEHNFDELAPLEKAGRLLGDLFAHVRNFPGVVDEPRAVAAVVQRLRSDPTFEAGILFRYELGLLTERASFARHEHTGSEKRPTDAIVLFEAGDRAVRNLLAGSSRMVDERDVPAAVLDKIEGAKDVVFITAPVRDAEEKMGCIIAAVRRDRVGRALRVSNLVASELSLTIRNAIAFDRIGDYCVDQERKQLAEELHSGVAQELARIQLELSHLASTTEGTSREHLEGLRGAVTDALTSVRASIHGLNASTSPGHLFSRLTAYVREVSRNRSVELNARLRGSASLAPDVEEVVFRCVQSIAEALISSGARLVSVEALGTPTLLTVCLNSPEVDEFDVADAKAHAASIGADIGVGEGQDGACLRLEIRVGDRGFEA